MSRALVGAVASVLATSCATVQPPLPTPRVVVFTGTVTVTGASRPVPGAVVMLRGSPVHVTTDADGHYRLAACLARGSQVALSASGYGAKSLPVRVDGDTVRVDLRLEPQSHTPWRSRIYVEGDEVVFTGIVIDATSRPVPGALVQLGRDYAITGPDGHYELVGRAAIGSDAILRAWRRGYYSAFQSVRVSVVRTAWADLRLSAVMPVEGC